MCLPVIVGRVSNAVMRNPTGSKMRRFSWSASVSWVTASTMRPSTR
jgi:hypothetical protein